MAKNRFAGMNEKMQSAVKKSDLQVSKKTKSSVISIKIDEIENPPFHDRYSMSNLSIKELAEDISVHGLINPIAVRLLENGKYQRISGFRRIEAYKLLDKKEIPAILFDIKEEIEILELMFAENQQREDPSEYDIVLFHLEALARMMDLDEDEIKKTISQARKIEQGSLDTKDLEVLKKVDVIKDLLNRTKAFPSINSFYQRMTNILSLHPILIKAIQEKKTYYTIAKELNKAKKSKKKEVAIENFLNESIKKRYSLTEAKKVVKKFLEEEGEESLLDKRRGELKRKMKMIINSMDKLADSDIEKIEKFLQKNKLL